MSAKHNSTPWWVTESGIRNRGGYICHTTPVTHFPGQDERYAKETAEREASKVLMAAAPDLLAALREIATDYADRFDLDDPSTNPGIKSSIAQARTAIAAATGETT